MKEESEVENERKQKQCKSSKHIRLAMRTNNTWQTLLREIGLMFANQTKCFFIRFVFSFVLYI